MEDAALLYKFFTQGVGIRQIPVMRDTKAAKIKIGKQWLNVAQGSLACCGIAYMPDGR